MLAIVALLATLLPPAGAQPAPPVPPTRPPAARWTALNSGTTATLNAVSFADPRIGHAVGAGSTIIATNDGGKTWRPQAACTKSRRCQSSSPDRITADLNGVSFADPSTGYAVGAGGTILATTDGGRRWTPQLACSRSSPCQASSPDKMTADLNGVAFSDRSIGYVVGDGGTILVTTDGGRRWEPQHACQDQVSLTAPASACAPGSPVHITADLAGVASPVPSHAFAVGAGGILLSTENTGRTWVASSACANPPCGGGIGGDIRDGRLVEVRTPPTQSLITADLTDVSFAGTKTGRAVGTGGTILTTDDGGLQWKPEPACRSGGACHADSPSRITVDLFGVRQPDTAHADAVGSGGTAIGRRLPAPWTGEDSGTTHDLLALSFPDANTGYAVGVGGTVLKQSSSTPDLRVESITPARGPTAGGTKITVTGSGLNGATQVNFGGLPAADVQVESDRRLTVATPVRAPGPVDVTVTTPRGSSSTRKGARFTYVAPTGGAWRPTASCEAACAGRAVQLASGKVLMAGTAAPASTAPGTAAELYDPVTSRWSGTGPLQEGRTGHSMTALADGRVLVAGGERINLEPTTPTDRFVELATAELFDPSTGTWRPTAPMPSPRSLHTATLLRDGRVLVVGGTRPRADITAEVRAGKIPSPFLGSAVIFEPGTETWASAGEISAPRILHTTTLLADGRVLVAGGSEGGGPSTAAAETYDPAANQWKRATPLGVPRNQPTATLLEDGRVLVVGGSQGEDSGVVFAELFDPRTGRWIATGPLAIGRLSHTATRLDDGRVLVVGGVASRTDPVLPLVELYDPRQGRWQLVRSLPGPRQGHTATLMDNQPCGSACGNVLIVGGSDCRCSQPADATYLYTPAGATAPGTATGDGPRWPFPAGIAVAMAGTGLVLVWRRRARRARPLER